MNYNKENNNGQKLPDNLSDFIMHSAAEKDPDGDWIIYVDGKNKRGAIRSSRKFEFQAKEDAWNYLCDLPSEAEKLKLLNQQ